MKCIWISLKKALEIKNKKKKYTFKKKKALEIWNPCHTIHLDNAKFSIIC